MSFNMNLFQRLLCTCCDLHRHLDSWIRCRDIWTFTIYGMPINYEENMKRTVRMLPTSCVLCILFLNLWSSQCEREANTIVCYCVLFFLHLSGQYHRLFIIFRRDEMPRFVTENFIKLFNNSMAPTQHCFPSTIRSNQGSFASNQI